MHWWRIFFVEAAIILVVMASLGYLKLPKFMRKRQLARGFPWGYYPDAVPKADQGFFADNTNDFLYDVGTGFGGMDGFGDFGEFTGFGAMGEFGGD